MSCKTVWVVILLSAFRVEGSLRASQGVAPYAPRSPAAVEYQKAAIGTEKPGVVSLVEGVPPVMSREHVERYEVSMQLSDAQSVVFRSLCEAMWLDDEMSREKSRAKLQGKSDSVRESGQPHLDTDAAAQHEDLMRESSRAMDSIEILEERVFSGLAVCLAEKQLPALERARYQRTSERSMVVGYYRHSAGANLSDVLREMKFDETCAPDPLAYQSLMIEYERTTAALRREHVKAYFRSRRECPKLLAAAETEGIDRAHMFQQVKSIQRVVNRLEQRLEQSNRLYVDLLAEQLPEETRNRFRGLFFASAYPEVHPDKSDASELIAEALSHPECPEEVKSEIIFISNKYRFNQEHLSDKMIERVIRNFDEFLALGGTRPDDLMTFREEMNDLQRQREANARNSVQAVLRLSEPLFEQILSRSLRQFDANCRHPGAPIGISYRP